MDSKHKYGKNDGKYCAYGYIWQTDQKKYLKKKVVYQINMTK